MFLRGIIYWTKFRDRNGKQKAVSLETSNKGLGKQREAKMRLEAVDGKFFDCFKGDKMNIMELLEMYGKRATGNKLAASSINQETSLRKTVNKAFGKMLLPNIKSLDVENYIHMRRVLGIMDSSIGNELNMLKAAYKLAAGQWELLRSNPYDRCCKPPKGKTLRDRYLLPDESLRLLGFLSKPENEWLRDVVIFARETGFRISNIMDLRFKQLDFERKVVTISGHYTKTNKPLSVPMSRNVYQILRFLADVKRHPEFVFVKWNKRLEKYTPRKPRMTSYDFKVACNKIGLEDFKFHDLRHDFCSRLVQAGQSLQVVQQLAGHTDIAMTQRYAHLAPAQKQDAIEIFNLDVGNNLVTMG